MHTETIKTDYNVYKKSFSYRNIYPYKKWLKNGNTTVFEIHLIEIHSIIEAPEEVWSKDNANSRRVHLIDRFILCDENQQRD